MALNLRDFLRALGPQLIRIEDEIDPITQAGALCSAAPRPIMLEKLRGFPGWKFCDILVKDRDRQALALGSTPKTVVRDLADRMFSAPNIDRSEVTVMRIGGKIAIDATKPALWRKKERQEFSRVKPKGADDPAIADLLKRLASMS